MADSSAHHEARSQALADSIRRFLIAVNTGGVATTFAGATSLADNGINPGWAAPSIGIFVLGLVLAGISMFLAQHREMKRRDAALMNEAAPGFGAIWWSWGWNLASLAVFVLATIVGLCSLASITLQAP